MAHRSLLVSVAFSAAVLTAGCGTPQAANGGKGQPQPGPGVESLAQRANQGEQWRPREGLEIWLGIRRDSRLRGELEPVTRILQDGKSVAGAMVFVRLEPSAGTATAGDELATSYEMDAESGTGFYTGAILKAPTDSPDAIVHYRVVLPDSDEELTQHQRFSLDSDD